jgi:hypothetical protein
MSLAKEGGATTPLTPRSSPYIGKECLLLSSRRAAAPLPLFARCPCLPAAPPPRPAAPPPHLPSRARGTPRSLDEATRSVELELRIEPKAVPPPVVSPKKKAPPLPSLYISHIRTD